MIVFGALTLLVGRQEGYTARQISYSIGPQKSTFGENHFWGPSLAWG